MDVILAITIPELNFDAIIYWSRDDSDISQLILDL